MGPNGTDAQRLLRDTAIVTRLRGGATVKTVAAEFHVSERSVRAIRTKRTSARSVLDETPITILEGLVKDYEAAIGDFDMMTYTHADANPPVAVAAMKGALVARRELADLLSDVGKLPAQLELYRAETVLRRLAEEMVVKMEQVDAGELTPGEAAAFFRELVGAGDAPMNGGGQVAQMGAST